MTCLTYLLIASDVDAVYEWEQWLAIIHWAWRVVCIELQHVPVTELIPMAVQSRSGFFCLQQLHVSHGGLTVLAILAVAADGYSK